MCQHGPGLKDEAGGSGKGTRLGNMVWSKRTLVDWFVGGRGKVGGAFLDIVRIRRCGRVLGKLVWRSKDPVGQEDLSRSGDTRDGHDVSPVTGRVAFLSRSQRRPSQPPQSLETMVCRNASRDAISETNRNSPRQ